MKDGYRSKRFIREGQEGGQGNNNTSVSSTKGGLRPLDDIKQLLVEKKVKADETSGPVAVPSMDLPSPGPPPVSKRRKEMDAFMEEIKARQASEPSSSALASGGSNAAGSLGPSKADSGSLDDGDPTTTNLYVGNLHPAVTEDRLRQVFGAYGSLLSIKIMWPRTEEERMKRRNCGFVSFWKRPDAQAAMDALGDRDLDGHIITVRWGRAVSKLSRGLEQDTLEKTVPEGVAGMTMTPFDDKITIHTPWDTARLSLIDRTARYVCREGLAFERLLQEHLKGDPRFTFLNDQTTHEGTYYRWKCISLAMGDSESKWREDPFRLYAGGSWWVPPQKAQLVQRLRRSERDGTGDSQRGGRLGGDAGLRLTAKTEKELRKMLQRLTKSSRSLICEAMALALDNADSSDHIISLYMESLLGEPSKDKDAPPSMLSPPAHLVARLYLANDLLHNSSAPYRNASSYRTLLGECLPEVFERLGGVLRGIEGRMSARQFQDKILGILHVWDRWSIYPPLYISGLETAFMRNAEDADFKGLVEDVEEENGDSDGEMKQDHNAIAKRAKQAGIWIGNLTSAQLLKRLEQLTAYVKAKKEKEALATGLGTPAPAQPTLSASAKSKTVEDEELDGVPLGAESDSDVDGAPLDDDSSSEEDIDGVPPTDSTPSKKAKFCFT